MKHLFFIALSLKFTQFYLFQEDCVNPNLKPFYHTKVKIMQISSLGLHKTRRERIFKVLNFCPKILMHEAHFTSFNFGAFHNP